MKKFYFLALFVLSVCIGASAQSDGDYYLDIKQDNTRYYFTWDAQKNLYTITIPELHGDFKIYDSEYVEGAGDQNQHVFGAADGQSAGIKPGEIKTCANPGNNFSVEGGGILYNVVMEFSPTDMTLNIVSGSSTKPEPTTPTISIAATGTATTPEAGTVDYTITAYAIDSPESLTYDITLAYIPAGNSDTSNVSTTLTGTLSGSQTLSDLTIGSTTTVTVTATATAADGTPLEASATTEITTPEIPILIGQLADGSWQPNVGVNGFTVGIPGVYYYLPTLVGDGEFSFVSKLGNSSDDWATVNAHPRYAPAADAQQEQAPIDTWIPYTRYEGSTTGSWVPYPYDASRSYLVKFDFNTQTVQVRYAEALSGIEDTAIPTDGPTDVYNLLGVRVSSGNTRAEATSGLPSGIYIVNGTKTIIR